jgi:Long-chain fatty acid transport protein
MKLRALSLCVAAAAAGLSFSSGAWATDGYFSDGYGMKASGRGGAAMGFTTDAFGGANNPASMVWVGNRLDVGVTLFMPQRGASRTGSANSMFPGDPGRDFNENSDRRNFPIPEFGYNHMLGSDMSLGLDVYGNGGLNTYYHNNAITNGGCGAPGNRNNLCGQGRLGVNLLQAIIAPTFAIKLTPIMSIGISPLFGVQSFKAQGLQAFQAPGFSIAPNQITNKGTDYSYGYGGRIGYMIKPLHWLTLGAAYSTKVYMSPINRYAGLFARAASSTSRRTGRRASRSSRSRASPSAPTSSASSTIRSAPSTTPAPTWRNWVATTARALAGRAST